MSLAETTDFQRIAKTIASEVANAVKGGTVKAGSITLPDPGILEVCHGDGDFYFVDDKEPRVIGWVHPLSKTEVVVQHCWGPSTYGGFKTPWLGLVTAVADFLLARGVPNMTWVAGNPLGIAGVTLTQATARADGTVSVGIAQAKVSLTAVAVGEK